MRILDKNRELNQLITNGRVEVNYPNDNHSYLYTLNGNYILCDGEPVGLHANTIDKRMDLLSQDARRACFIEEILNKAGINIDNIESDYDVLCSDKRYIVFFNQRNNYLTFIEFKSDENIDCDYGVFLKVVKLDLDNNELIYDRFDLINLNYYHSISKISKYTLKKINESWSTKILTQNDLYDIKAEDTPYPTYGCSWNAMDNYGQYIGKINIDQLDTNICEVKEKVNSNKTYIYY